MCNILTWIDTGFDGDNHDTVPQSEDEPPSVSNAAAAAAVQIQDGWRSQLVLSTELNFVRNGANEPSTQLRLQKYEATLQKIEDDIYHVVDGSNVGNRRIQHHNARNNELFADGIVREVYKIKLKKWLSLRDDTDRRRYDYHWRMIESDRQRLLEYLDEILLTHAPDISRKELTIVEPTLGSDSAEDLGKHMMKNILRKHEEYMKSSRSDGDYEWQIQWILSYLPDIPQGDEVESDLRKQGVFKRVDDPFTDTNPNTSVSVKDSTGVAARAIHALIRYSKRAYTDFSEYPNIVDAFAKVAFLYGIAVSKYLQPLHQCTTVNDELINLNMLKQARRYETAYFLFKWVLGSGFVYGRKEKEQVARVDRFEATNDIDERWAAVNTSLALMHVDTGVEAVDRLERALRECDDVDQDLQETIVEYRSQFFALLRRQRVSGPVSTAEVHAQLIADAFSRNVLVGLNRVCNIVKTAGSSPLGVAGTKKILDHVLDMMRACWRARANSWARPNAAAYYLAEVDRLIMPARWMSEDDILTYVQNDKYKYYITRVVAVHTCNPEATWLVALDVGEYEEAKVFEVLLPTLMRPIAQVTDESTIAKAMQSLLTVTYSAYGDFSGKDGALGKFDRIALAYSKLVKDYLSLNEISEGQGDELEQQGTRYSKLLMFFKWVFDLWPNSEEVEFIPQTEIGEQLVEDIIRFAIDYLKNGSDKVTARLDNMKSMMKCDPIEVTMDPLIKQILATLRSTWLLMHTYCPERRKLYDRPETHEILLNMFQTSTTYAFVEACQTVTEKGLATPDIIETKLQAAMEILEKEWKKASEGCFAWMSASSVPPTPGESTNKSILCHL
eukprot:GHVU01201460.1.p1 GENE.GHVU01201460.1~~GHVU01201460.1.p1  ORF type:complete len:841 (-),score=90.09 GHVU01201460.1:331-2853(-)